MTGDQPRGEVLDEVCGKIRRPPTIICRLFDDGTTADVAEATEFCADLPESISAAAGLAAGTRSHAEIAEVPAVRPSARVLCVGLDYRLHAAEVGLTIPECPALFGRWTPSLVAGDIPVPVPFGEPGLDWEVELAVVVGRPLHRVDAAAALGGVFGYAAFNDRVRAGAPDASAALDSRQERRSERPHLANRHRRRGRRPHRRAPPWCPGSTAR